MLNLKEHKGFQKEHKEKEDRKPQRLFSVPSVFLIVLGDKK